MADTKPRTAGEGRRLTPWDDNLDSMRVAADMRERAYRIRKMQQDAVVEVGRQLLAAKEQVAHGCFRAWVETACQMHIRTAERAMQAARMVEENDKLSYLPPDGLLALAAPSVPEGAKAKIVEQINADAKPTAAEIKRQIKAAKHAQKRAVAQQSGEVDSNAQDEQADRASAARKAVDLLYKCFCDQFDAFLALFDKGRRSLWRSRAGETRDICWRQHHYTNHRPAVNASRKRQRSPDYRRQPHHNRPVLSYAFRMPKRSH